VRVVEYASGQQARGSVYVTCMSLKRGRKGGPLQRGEPGDAHAGEPGALVNLRKLAYQRHCGNCRASCDVHSMHVAAVPLLCSSLVTMASSVFRCGCCGLRYCEGW
jgi:hypothetical protein